MKAENKKMLIIIGAIALAIILVLVIVFSGNNKNQSGKGGEENQIPINTSEKLNEVKTLNGLEFSNIKFETTNGGTNLVTTITNKTGKDIGEDGIYFNARLLDKDGNLITTLKGQVDSLKADDSTVLKSFVTITYTNIYDVEFVEESK